VERPHTNQVASATLAKAALLHQAAKEARNACQYVRAAHVSGRAVALAEAAGDQKAVVDYRSLQAQSLFNAGRLRAQLAVLAPCVSRRPEGANDRELFRCLIRYVETGILIPIRKDAILRAFWSVEAFLIGNGTTEWKSALLFVKSELCRVRGDLKQALSYAQEAWALRRDEEPSYHTTSHHEQRVECCVAVRDLEMARRYQAEWEQANADSGMTHTLQMSKKARLARLEGRVHQAIDMARQATVSADATDGVELHRAAWVELARALLAAGDVVHARSAVVRAMRFRLSECEHLRYDAQLLRADYHIACARVAAGMAVVDDEFCEEFPSPERPHDGAGTRSALRKARTAYSSALTIGSQLDQRLECTWRQDQIAARLARVEGIDRKCP
jgi:tetratricopeptide (TPR) repeat protein